MTGSMIGTLRDRLATVALEEPDREFVVLPDERITYSAFLARVDDLSKALLAAGVGREQRVGTLLHNSVEQLVLWFAVSSLGATCLPINTRNRGRELSHVIEDAGLRLVLTSDAGSSDADLPRRLLDALEGGWSVSSDDGPAAGDAIQVVCFGPSARSRGMLPAAEFIERGRRVDADSLRERRSEVSPDSAAIMLYTSGTTASPKGCALTHRQLLETCTEISRRLGMRASDRVWNATPMFHASSILPLLACLEVRGTFLTQRHLDPADALRLMVHERADLAWPAFHPIWQSVLTLPEFDPDALASLRTVLCVGPSEALREVESRLPAAPVLNCYGITEGGGIPILVDRSDAPPIRTGTAGLPMPGIEAVVREPGSGRELAPGERGLLWLRGRNVIDEYWNDPVKTTESFDGEGWFYTGDLCSIDEAGCVTYHGRVKEMLKVGGENVAAVEVEGFLMTHPAVKIAVVVPAPDEKYGQVPAAFLELKPGATASAEAMVEFCRGQIAAFKVPRYVRFVSEWPMSATKILKRDLVVRIEEEIAPPGPDGPVPVRGGGVKGGTAGA